MPAGDHSGRDSWTLAPVAKGRVQVSSNSQPFAGVVYGARAARVLRCRAPSGKTDRRTRRTHGSHHPGRRRTLRVAVVHRALIVRPAGYILLSVLEGTGSWPVPELILPAERFAWPRWPGERLYIGLCSRRFTVPASALLQVTAVRWQSLGRTLPLLGRRPMNRPYGQSLTDDSCRLFWQSLVV